MDDAITFKTVLIVYKVIRGVSSDGIKLNFQQVDDKRQKTHCYLKHLNLRQNMGKGYLHTMALDFGMLFQLKLEKRQIWKTLRRD